MLEAWYFAIPPVTRAYLTLSFLLTASTALGLVSPHQLYLNWRLVSSGEVWRLITTFVYLDDFSVDFFFQIYFLYLDSSSLEEHFYHRRTDRFVFMLLFAVVCLLPLSWPLGLMFLSHPMSFFLLYVWSRRNPDMHVSIYGIFTLRAPFLPWFLLVLDSAFGDWLASDLCGVAFGHIFWFMEDIAPRVLGRPKGVELFKTPALLAALFPSDRLDAAEHAD
eukprot:TRINITY_DN70296_c0_g1_i1.p1 TRINITY_DN70296_c0_g1~~TRINITY_DN70296_c0_g1_i1.p1  ORF type:complete len:220 (+),score=66.54 TRINITY_DN70296_c0_g1_i1:68-727(+)